jgi:hypothetical protein
MSHFPSQVVSDIEKLSFDYGLRIARAIESEWFDSTRSTERFFSSSSDFHKLRLYARGEQGTQKYKDELSINGDLSYLNLDWKPVPIIPKFVDIVVNGIAERMYDINAYSQDPYGVSKRTEYMDSLLGDLHSKDLNMLLEETLGISLNKNPKEELPDSEEELELHMQLNYKQAVELAEEQALNTLFEGNNYELTKKRFFYDLTTIGIGAVKTGFDTSQGITIEYVDPANLIYSHTNSPYFEDVYYIGEVKTIPINELVKQFPGLTPEELKEISTSSRSQYTGPNHLTDWQDSNKISII